MAALLLRGRDEFGAKASLADYVLPVSLSNPLAAKPPDQPAALPSSRKRMSLARTSAREWNLSHKARFTTGRKSTWIPPQRPLNLLSFIDRDQLQKHSPLLYLYILLMGQEPRSS